MAAQLLSTTASLFHKFQLTYLHTEFPCDIVFVPLQNWKQGDKKTSNKEVPLLKL